MSADTIVAAILNGRLNALGQIVHDHTEKAIADGLAAFADAHGWLSVRREVVVPGWGRLDLLLQSYDETWAVESGDEEAIYAVLEADYASMFEGATAGGGS